MVTDLVFSLAIACGRHRYNWDYVMVFEVRAEDKELTSYQRKFSMKEILTRLNAGGKRSGTGIGRSGQFSSNCHDLTL